MPQAIYYDAEASLPSGHASMQARAVVVHVLLVVAKIVCCGKLLYSGGDLQSEQGNHCHLNTTILVYTYALMRIITAMAFAIAPGCRPALPSL